MSSTGKSGSSVVPFFRKGIIALLIILPALFVQLYFEGNWYAIAHRYSLAMVFGIISYTLFCCTLLLSTRLHFLDKLFGNDSVLRLHGYIAAISIVTGCIHYLLKSGYLEKNTLQSTIGSSALILFLAIMVITVVLMTSGFPVRMQFLSRLRVNASERFNLDYSLIKLIHNGFSLAVALILIHVFIASSTQETVLRMSLMGLLGGGTLARYMYHKLIRPQINRKKGCTLEKIEQPAHDIVRLYIASDSDKRVGFLPGQFCYLRLHTSETGGEEHPFTLSSSPTTTTIAMTIKNLGNYTAKLAHLKTGTPVSIDGPYGIFTPAADGRKKVFIAGGIGITPFMSILSTWYKEENIPDTTLIWSVRTEEDLIDLQHFEKMHTTCPWFTFIPALTKSQNRNYRQGRINRDLLSEIFTDSDISPTDVFICGPAPMVRITNRYCRSCGVPRRNIHFERFSF